MKISEISIKDFRAFYTPDVPITIKLGQGKNLLVYGENGSGKSSLFLAIKRFFESSARSELKFKDDKNLFTSADDGFVRLKFEPSDSLPPDGFCWSKEGTTATDKNAQFIRDAHKTKGFLDYKTLSEIHFLHEENGQINVFQLLINHLLADIPFGVTGKSFHNEWKNLQNLIVQPLPEEEDFLERYEDSEDDEDHKDAYQAFIDTKLGETDDAIKEFSSQLEAILQNLEEITNDILEEFRFNIKIELIFVRVYRSDDPKIKEIQGQHIGLRVYYFGKKEDGEGKPLIYQRLLNEAKLSAIALSIYLGALQLQPSSQLKVLALDDVLVGLDMANRIPVLKILDDKFKDFQIIITTYDRVWYEVIKKRTRREPWKHVEMFSAHTDEYEIPFCSEDFSLLERARIYLNKHEYKAAVIHLRTHFELVLKNYCEEKSLPVKYAPIPEKADSNDFWTAILASKFTYRPSSGFIADKYGNLVKKNGQYFEMDRPPITRKLITPEMEDRVELYRSLILNPLSHSEITNANRREIEEAIEMVADLEALLESALKGEPEDMLKAKQEFADTLLGLIVRMRTSPPSQCLGP